jgi:isocitrate dehydrogenase kinase/phosphatase
VGPGDVFPEQITTYVTAQNDIRQMLIQSHPELMDAGYWQQKQQRIRDGVVEDVFPYPQHQRFQSLYPAEYAKGEGLSTMPPPEQT